jgi:hypothetical protein
MRRYALSLVLAAALCSAGCAVRPADARATDPQGNTILTAPASHAGSWEVVFPGARLASASGSESARLDSALAVRPAETVIDQTRWPPSRGPSLDDLRGRFLSDDPRVINFYSGRRHAPSWWYGGWGWR